MMKQKTGKYEKVKPGMNGMKIETDLRFNSDELEEFYNQMVELISSIHLVKDAHVDDRAGLWWDESVESIGAAFATAKVPGEKRPRTINWGLDGITIVYKLQGSRVETSLVFSELFEMKKEVGWEITEIWIRWLLFRAGVVEFDGIDDDDGMDGIIGTGKDDGVDEAGGLGEGDKKAGTGGSGEADRRAGTDGSGEADRRAGTGELEGTRWNGSRLRTGGA